MESSYNSIPTVETELTKINSRIDVLSELVNSRSSGGRTGGMRYADLTTPKLTARLVTGEFAPTLENPWGTRYELSWTESVDQNNKNATVMYGIWVYDGNSWNEIVRTYQLRYTYYPTSTVGNSEKIAVRAMYSSDGHGTSAFSNTVTLDYRSDSKTVGQYTYEISSLKSYYTQQISNLFSQGIGGLYPGKFYGSGSEGHRDNYSGFCSFEKTNNLTVPTPATDTLLGGWSPGSWVVDQVNTGNPVKFATNSALVIGFYQAADYDSVYNYGIRGAFTLRKNKDRETEIALFDSGKIYGQQISTPCTLVKYVSGIYGTEWNVEFQAQCIHYSGRNTGTPMVGKRGVYIIPLANRSDFVEAA